MRSGGCQPSLYGLSWGTSVIGPGKSAGARCSAASWMRTAALPFGLLVALALPAAAVAGGAPGVKGSTRISNERTLTRWAHPVHRAPIRWRPTAHARRVARTHLLTEDGFPEVYVALRTWSDPQGHIWRQLRVPGRPNGRTGWVRNAALGPLYRVRTRLVVDRRSLRATLYRRGRRIWSAPVGGVIGIHGTNEPSLIPGRPSHGCVRVRNAAIEHLWRLMPIGTPVLIR
jgi:hypothetical protein